MKALTFKEKQDVLEDLFKKYHRAVLQLKCLEERNFYPTIQFDTVKEKSTYPACNRRSAACRWSDHAGGWLFFWTHRTRNIDCNIHRSHYAGGYYSRIWIYGRCGMIGRYSDQMTFEFILDCLSMESKVIIEKEFIERVGKDWWIDYYSRSTYYRLKTRAMEETLFYFSCL